MRIGVVSDSHNNLYMLDKAIQAMGDIDLLMHLGDSYKDILKVNNKYHFRIEYVAGNNDFFGSTKLEDTIEVCGKRIFITHGHRYNVNYDLFRLQYKAEEENADIVLYGHTHIFDAVYIGDIFFLNPGSVSRPRAGKPSACIVYLKEDGEVDIERILL